MIERWCSWHRPAPILLEKIPDGRPGILRTDGLCPDCLFRELGHVPAGWPADDDGDADKLYDELFAGMEV